MTHGQMNTQAFSVQMIIIFMQQFYSVIPVYCKGDFKCNFNHKSYYVVTTTRINNSYNYSNIKRVLSSVNSLISDHKEF